jgi:peptide deformylase
MPSSGRAELGAIHALPMRRKARHKRGHDAAEDEPEFLLAGIWAPAGRPRTKPWRCIDRLSATAYIAAMARRDILILPDKRLRQVSEPVKQIDAGVRTLVGDMFDSMYDAPGIGLAAIQIGAPIRVITMDLAKKDEPRSPQVFLNPAILWLSEETSVYEEGCLSIPEFYEDVERPSRVKVGFLDLEGQPREVEAEGLLATCLQHEIDHLNGVLFIDHLSRLKRDRVLKKFTKAAKRAAG